MKPFVPRQKKTVEDAKAKAADVKQEGDKEAATKQKQEIAQAQGKAESEKRSIATQAKADGNKATAEIVKKESSVIKTEDKEEKKKEEAKEETIKKLQKQLDDLKESKKKINDAIVGYVQKGADHLKEPIAAAAAAAPPAKKEDDKTKSVASSFSTEELNGPLIFGLLSANILTASFAFKFYKHSNNQKTFSSTLLEF